MDWWKIIRGTARGEPEDYVSNPDFRKRELADYVQRARESGLGNEEIKSGLLERGWAESLIDEILSTPPQPPAPVLKTSKKSSV